MRVGQVHIIGAGLAGLTLALALNNSGKNSGKNSGFKITLVDVGSKSALYDFAADMRTTALAYTTKVMMDKIGVWSDVAEAASPIDSMLVSSGSSRTMRFDPSGFCDHPMGYIVPNAALKKALIEQIEDCANIELQFNTQLTGFTSNPNGLNLNLINNADGTEQIFVEGTNLLLGCDGRTSKVRQLAGFSVFQRDYKQTAIVGTVDLSRPHHQQAFQVFTKTGPIALLPLPQQLNGKTSASLIWSHDAKSASELKDLDANMFLDLLNRHIDKDFATATAVGPRQVFPLHAHYLANFVDDNLALVGEAAHGVHPLAGQGFNLTARDIGCLCDVLFKAKQVGERLGSKRVLETYESQRAADTSRMFGFTDQMTYMLAGNTRLPSLVRDLGFSAVDQLNGVRDKLTKHAMGQVDNLPTLMQENWQQKFAAVG